MKARLPGIALVLIAAVYGMQVLKIPVPSADALEAMTPRTLPAVLAVALGFIGLVMVVRPASSETSMEASLSGASNVWLRAVGLLLLGLLFAMLIDPLGVLFASALILALALYLMGIRRPVVLIGVSLGFSASLWLLLVVVLGLFLHPGDLWTADV